MKKWYQDWRSWLTILLLFFLPTFLIGVIVMWAIAPWSKKAKWWVTGVGVGLPLIGVLVTFFLVSLSPKKQVSKAEDVAKKAYVQEIVNQSSKFCIEKEKCPTGLSELQQAGYISGDLNKKAGEEEIGYISLFSGKNCRVNVILSTGDVYAQNCFSTGTP